MRYLLLLGLIGSIGQPAVAGEQLLVLLQDRPTQVARQFQESLLPEIRVLAKELGLALDIRQISDKAPKEVAITPLLVFQNARGRSIYQGRLNTMERIRNFIRTARHVPQGNQGLPREQTAVRQMGRARIWAPVKITELTGSLPENFDQDAFQQESRKAVHQGFRFFKLMPNVLLGRADRGFYLDLYPYRSKEGILFLSLAIFSQFHCKQAVFSTGDSPLMGPWDQRDQLFFQAARQLETVVQQKIEDGFGGDGFDPVDDRVKDVTWEEFGYPLPLAEKTEHGPVMEGDLPGRWKLQDPAPQDGPMIQFRFPPPLDNHAGEAVKAGGELLLTPDLKPGAARGEIRVETTSVTMGQKELDQFIRSSMVLNAAQFPLAAFTISSGEDTGEPLAFGRLSQVAYGGNFSLKGKIMPLKTAVQIEPVITEKGEKRLLMQGNFQMDLKAFDIQGPDGPAPANHMLLFDVNFVLRPVDSEPAATKRD